MRRNEDEVLEGLRLEYEQANAAPSASIGLTPLQQAGAGSFSEEMADELTHTKAPADKKIQPHSLQ